MAQVGIDLDDDLVLLDARLKHLKFEYEQYFLGHRPREPQLARGEVQKIIALWSQRSVQNTRQRFQLRNLCSRFYTFRRQWDVTLRRIEEGTYGPAKERTRRRGRSPAVAASGEARAGAGPAGSATSDLFDAYLDARRSCGQGIESLTRDKLTRVIESQLQAIREKTGCRDVRFRIAVEDGRAKLKATPLRD